MIDDSMIKRIALECGMREPGPLSQESERFYPHNFAERMARACYAAGQRDEREACAAIAATPVSGEQDDITMEAKDRIAAAIRARTEGKT